MEKRLGWVVPYRGASNAPASGGGPNGVALDCEGSLAVIGPGTESVFSSSDEPLLRTQSPGGRPTNLAFGGPDRRTLFINALGNGVILIHRMPCPSLPCCHEAAIHPMRSKMPLPGVLPALFSKALPRCGRHLHRIAKCSAVSGVT